MIFKLLHSMLDIRILVHFLGTLAILQNDTLLLVTIHPLMVIYLVGTVRVNNLVLFLILVEFL